MHERVGIIGMGYVGLPLAVEAGRLYATLGYDLNEDRIDELRKGYDSTREVSKAALQSASALHFTANPQDLENATFYIITTPTPLDENNNPDLSYIESASRTVGRVLSKGDVVVYESTVYPGCTREVCVPLLEAESGLTFNKDFYCGYSPERINPGDKKKRLTQIVKITSGSTPLAAKRVDAFYKSIIQVGTHKASSMEIAEAAKVIENAQRDINIAFVNELSLIFHHLNLDTKEVLAAAQTKWNFLPFTPGLVGGHCIGVDPYYLAYKAEACGYHPEIILSGRRINDSMGSHIGQRFVKMLCEKGICLTSAHILILGMTFKENCPDVRNSRVYDIVKELKGYHIHADVYDPWADPALVKREYGIELLKDPYDQNYEGVLVTVAHDQFKEVEWQRIVNEKTVILDVKGIVPAELASVHI